MKFGRFMRRVRYWLKRNQREASLREEMEFHLELKIEQLVETGMSDTDARGAARRKFGNVGQKAEDSRATWVARWLSELIQDLVFAARTFSRERGFTTVAVLSAALGIGACSTIFGIANFALFHPLAVDQPSRLIAISGTSQRAPGGGQYLSFPDFQDLQNAQSLAGLTAFFPMLPASISASGEPQRDWGAIVTANYFEVIRPKFILGHGFNAAQDDTPGEAPVVVLSHNLWQARFGGDPNIVGKTIEINRVRATVLGVTAPGFRGAEVAIISDFWVPFSMIGDFASLPMEGSGLKDRNGQSVMAIGRLRDGVTAGQCRAELDVIAKRLGAQYPESNKNRGFRTETAGQINPALRPIVAVLFSLLLGVTILVLFTACANVANLLLARASARQKEIATRLAMGARRGRLVRQLLTESVMLGLLGGVGGFLLAYWGTASIGKFKLPISLPVDFSVSLDGHVVLFCLALSILTGIIFGLVPSLRATKTDLVSALKDGPVTVGALRGLTLRSLLVIAQVAISMLLLICSGLFLRSLYSSRTMNIGVKNRDVLLLSFDPTLGRYNDVQSRQFMKSLLDRAQTMPGIESASLTDSVPLSLGGNHDTFVPEDKLAQPANNKIFADIYRIGPGFFETLGIPILHGDDFRPELGEHGDVAVVNEALAKRAFPNQNPIGRRIYFRKRMLRITAVVATSKSRTVGEEARSCLYLPLLDIYNANGGNLFGITLLLKTRGDPASYVSAVRNMIRGIDPALAVFGVHTLQAHLSDALILPRMAALTFGLCGFMGLLISTIGIYGVISFAVARRTKEIGIRMALGVPRMQVLAMVLRQGLMLTAVGCCIGIAMAFAVSGFARSILYGIRPNDPLTFAVAPLILLAVALTACLIPARRAAALDPMISLRYE